MSKRPLAWRHLKRVYELVTNASICRVMEEKQLIDNESIQRAANTDKAIAEEVLTLALHPEKFFYFYRPIFAR